MRVSLNCLTLSLLFAGLWFTLQVFRPLHDYDIFWQVRAGQLLWEHGELINSEPFAAGHAEERFPPLSWLCQLIYAKLQSLGGWRLLHSFDAWIWVSAFIVTAATMRRETGPIAIFVATILGFIASFPFASTRPQSWALLSFALFLALLRSHRHGWVKILISIPLLVVWQNLHPSVSVAGLVVGVLFTAHILRLPTNSTRPHRFDLTLFAIGSATLLASIATPAGWSIFELAARNAELSHTLGVNEWQPLWHSSNHETRRSVCFAFVVTVCLTLRRTATPPARDLLPAAFLFIMTVFSIRFVVFWSIAMIPVWATMIGPGPAPWQNRRSFAAGVTALLALMLAAGLPWWFRPDPLSETLPIRGAETLKAAGVEGVIFTDARWGGPLIFVGQGRWTVTKDGRYYSYTASEWEEYNRTWYGEASVEEIVARHHPAAFFLDRREWAELIEMLKAHPGWISLESHDSQVEIFVPKPNSE